MEMGRPSFSVSGSTHELETLPEGEGEQAEHNLHLSLCFLTAVSCDRLPPVIKCSAFGL